MDGEPTGSTPIQSDETLFSIIETLEALDGAGVTELANAVGKSKSTVHKHLTSLHNNDYVTKTNDTYYLGLKFFAHGMTIRNRQRVYHAARDIIDALAEETRESVSLILPENGRSIFVYGAFEYGSLDVDMVVGKWKPLHVTSSGKAILAHYSPERVNQIIDRHGLPKITENTITDVDTLLAELEDIRERGYATNNKEDMEGMSAVGVPILVSGEPIAGISVSGAASRIDTSPEDNELAERLVEVADDVGVRLAFD